MINYDGTCRKLIQEINSQIPKSIVFWQGFLYWTDSRSKVIYKTSVENGETKNSGIQLNANVLTVDFYGHAENCKKISKFDIVTCFKFSYPRVLPVPYNSSLCYYFDGANDSNHFYQ